MLVHDLVQGQFFLLGFDLWFVESTDTEPTDMETQLYSGAIEEADIN